MNTTKAKQKEFSDTTLKDKIFPYWLLSKELGEWHRKVHDFLESKPMPEGSSRDIMDLCRHQLEVE